jgi:hypothetical protein
MIRLMLRRLAENHSAWNKKRLNTHLQTLSKATQDHPWPQRQRNLARSTPNPDQLRQPSLCPRNRIQLDPLYPRDSPLSRWVIEH